jgi:hypothetical protein
MTHLLGWAVLGWLAAWLVSLSLKMIYAHGAICKLQAVPAPSMYSSQYLGREIRACVRCAACSAQLQLDHRSCMNGIYIVGIAPAISVVRSARAVRT